jgi:hypothetical protein
MWEIRDENSAYVAKDVYAWMLGDKSRQYLDTTKSAEGLHHAVRYLREKTRVDGLKRKGPSDPLVWAPYIHFGV